MDTLQTSHLVDMIRTIATTLERETDTLNDLDAALGDGDHGTGIGTAFALAAEQVSDLEDPQPVDVLRTTAMALMNRMGGGIRGIKWHAFSEGQHCRYGKINADNRRYRCHVASRIRRRNAAW